MGGPEDIVARLGAAEERDRLVEGKEERLLL